MSIYYEPRQWMSCSARQATQLCLHVRVQPLQVVEPHLDGEGAHLQGSDAPALAAGGGAPAPSRRQVELLNTLRTRVFLHEGVPW